MPQLDRNGVKVHYEAHGSGPVVLLSHGYSATTAMWAGQIPALVAAGWQAVVWDMRGHGQSDSPDDPACYSEALTLADMDAVLDAVGADRAVIAGLSLGGYMSLAFNVRHPERVRALMLFDTGPGYRKDEARDGWNAMAERTAERFEERGLEALGRGVEVRVSAAHSPVGLAHAARGMLAQRDATVIESLPTIAVPTLVLIGSEDERFMAGTDYMASRIPGARKAVIDGAGHAANIDRPEPFNEAMLEFLAAL
jgi:pimeloyl-ACP methyl ester carboxylesterase